MFQLRFWVPGDGLNITFRQLDISKLGLTCPVSDPATIPLRTDHENSDDGWTGQCVVPQQ
jgi:hypothetical protein